MSAPFGPPPAIILAAKRGDTDAVRRLVRAARGDDPSSQAARAVVEARNASYLDRTALHYAAEAGNLDLARLLISECGATVDAPDRAGETPLHLAVRRRRRETVTFLVDECDADVRRPGKGGDAALHCASRAGDVELIAFLLERGASARQRNEKGGTPMDAAFRRKGMMDLTNRIQEMLQRAVDEEDRTESGE